MSTQNEALPNLSLALHWTADMGFSSLRNTFYPIFLTNYPMFLNMNSEKCPHFPFLRSKMESNIPNFVRFSYRHHSNKMKQIRTHAPRTPATAHLRHTQPQYSQPPSPQI
jgi:hypothetical protein